MASKNLCHFCGPLVRQLRYFCSIIGCHNSSKLHFSLFLVFLLLTVFLRLSPALSRYVAVAKPVARLGWLHHRTIQVQKVKTSCCAKKVCVWLLRHHSNGNPMLSENMLKSANEIKPTIQKSVFWDCLGRSGRDMGDLFLLGFRLF